MAGGIYNPFGFGGGEVPQPVPRRMPQDIPAAPFGFAPPPSKWDQVKQALWETNLNAPIRGAYNLMNADPYTLYTDTGAAGQQAATDSFDAGGGITVGSAMIPKPSNALSMGIKAYHGSPHSFDQFSMDKIGTGEGAQAYGHGLYFAEKEDIARSYRDALSPAVIDGKPVDYSAANDLAASWFTAFKDRSKAADYLQRLIDNPPKSLPNFRSPEEIQATKDAIGLLRSDAPISETKPSGSMYEVNIDADPNAFLDWDKPFANGDELEQFAAKFDSVNPSIRKKIEDWGYERDKAGQPMPDGSDLIREVFGGIGAKEAQQGQQMLKEAGIPGIKYLDAGSRGKGVAHVQPMYKGQPYGDPVPATAWNQVDQLTQRYKDMGYDVEVQDLGTRNFVVFDDKLISIVKKYGIAGASAMLGYNLLEGINPAQADELKRIEAGK